MISNVTKSEQDLELVYSEMQDEIYNQLPLDNQFIVLAKGRRSGATTGAIQYIIEKGYENALSVLWIDTIQQNLVPLYQRYFYPYVSQFKPQFYEYRKSVHELSFFNSNIYFRSAEKPESLEGFYYDIAVLNEAGIILKGEKGRRLWLNSIYPMLLDRAGQCHIIGTPKGLLPKKGEDADFSLFYELYQKGQTDPGWASRRYSSFCNVELLSHQVMIGYKNRGIELTPDQARAKTIEALNRMANDYPLHIRSQEIYGQFIDKSEESIFHEHWFDIVDELPHPSKIKHWIMSLDTAFKIGESNDFSAAIVLCQTHNGHFYIVDIMNEKLEFPQLITKVKSLYNDYPECRYVLVEDRASGISLIQVLRQESSVPVFPVQVTKDKLTRASTITTVFEQMRVHLLRASWNDVYINQLCQFNGLFDSDDDLVDATSQALNFLNPSTVIGVPKVFSKKVVRTSDSLRGYNVRR